MEKVEINVGLLVAFCLVTFLQTILLINSVKTVWYKSEIKNKPTEYFRGQDLVPVEDEATLDQLRTVPEELLAPGVRVDLTKRVTI